MKRSFAFLILFVVAANHLDAEEFDVYFLGGQSNMEGFGSVAELPIEMQNSVEGAMIFHSPAVEDQQPDDGAGKWSIMQPGHGTKFAFEEGRNVYSDRFGCELSFARHMIHSSPQRRVAIIKYARNGSSIAIDAASHWGCWEPDFEADEGERRNINQYDHAIATIRNALSVTDIDGDGEIDQLTPRGIIWMQGESDAANSHEVAKRYSCNLKRLIDLLRAALRYDDLPVVIGRISDSGQNERGKIWEHGDIVRDQQEKFVQEDPAAALVTATDDYEYSDRFHYDSEGYLDLGHEFAKAILCLQSSVSNSEQQ